MSHELDNALFNPREWLQSKLSDPNYEAVLNRRGYLAELFAFSDWRADRPLSKELIDDYHHLLQRSGYSTPSIKRAMGAIDWWLESLLAECSKDEEPDLTLDEIRKIVASFNPSHNHPPAPAPSGSTRISKSQLQTIMRVCARDLTPRGLRDAAIVMLLVATEINYTSLIRLTIYNVRSNGTDAFTLSFKRKDKQEQEIDLPTAAAKSISNWIGFRGQNLGPLFYEIKGSDRVLWGNAMTESSVRQMLKSRLEEAKSPIDQPDPATAP